uniref:Uncharacterized protein n=1 Tax=Oryza punctata TaxID=4537 RepID=A0A0E0L1J0_ORYPU
MDVVSPPDLTKPDLAETAEPTQSNTSPAKQVEFPCELPPEFRVRSPPPPSPPYPFPLSPSMEEEGTYAEDFGYISTPCPSPPSDIDDLNPLEEDLRSLPPHPAYKDDSDNEIVNEEINNFRDDQTPPREAQSPATRLKRRRRS